MFHEPRTAVGYTASNTMFIDCIKQSPVEIPRLSLRDHLKINRRAQAQNSNQTKIHNVSEFMFFFFNVSILIRMNCSCIDYSNHIRVV